MSCAFHHINFSADSNGIVIVRKTVSLPIAEAEIYPNETLLRNGYLGCSPLTPTVAISLRSLRAYRQTHRTCPRYSVDALAKTLCHLHNVCTINLPDITTFTAVQVPYKNYLQKQLMIAFDSYLEICRQVDKKLNDRLGHDTPRARLNQQCPPCFFRVQGEQDLEFSVMVSMDGNNSLKHIAASIRVNQDLSDSRTIDSDRWITADEVNRFKDEVAQVGYYVFLRD